jgi:hypothetical protein
MNNDSFNENNLNGFNQNTGLPPQMTPQLLQQLQIMQQLQQAAQLQQQNQYIGETGGTSIAALRNKQIINQPQQPQQADYHINNKIETHQQQKDMAYLVSDINKSLDNLSPSSKIDSEIDTDTESTEIEEVNESKKNLSTYFPDSVKEIVLLVILYVTLSSEFVKGNVGKYIKYINPRQDGTISMIGILIYGIMLASVFALSKRILLK